MTRNNRNIILVSPAPVDGLPPVQHQARLLADAGYKVTLLTSCLNETLTVCFSHPTVSIAVFHMSAPGFLTRLANKLLYCLSLFRLRLSLRPVCEISYDPDGLFFASICPLKPSLLIGHLHEALIDPTNRFYERFAISFLPRLSLIVVADQDRAELLATQLKLSYLPQVVRNFPFPESSLASEYTTRPSPFSVVYHGSIGVNQALDNIIISMRHWPIDVCFYVYGNPRPEIKQRLETIAEECGVSDRLKFQGWVPYSKIKEKISSYSLGLSFYRNWHQNLSFTAGASNKRYQYMQAGIPQIADDTPSVKELIEGNKIGLCVSPESPEAIAGAVNYFYLNPDICAEYGRRARKLVEKKFRYDLEFRPVLDFINNSKCAAE